MRKPVRVELALASPRPVKGLRRTYRPALENEAERTRLQGFESLFSCGVVRCLAHGFPTILNRWHYHPEYELHLIVSTHGKAYVGDYIGRYGPGHLVLTAPNLPHNWLVDDLPPGGIQEHIHKVLQFKDETLRQSAQFLGALDELMPMFERARYGIEFFAMSALAEQRFEEIRQSSGLKRLSVFLGYLSELAECKSFRLLSESRVTFLPNDNTRQDAEMVEYVANNALNDIALKDVSEKFGMSEKYFSKHFKRTTGNTFTDFILHLRVHKACQMLSESEMYVSSVCHAVGFNNVANFNRHFFKIKGMTPSDFRRASVNRFGDAFSPQDQPDWGHL